MFQIRRWSIERWAVFGALAMCVGCTTPSMAPTPWAQHAAAPVSYWAAFPPTTPTNSTHNPTYTLQDRRHVLGQSPAPPPGFDPYSQQPPQRGFPAPPPPGGSTGGNVPAQFSQAPPTQGFTNQGGSTNPGGFTPQVPPTAQPGPGFPPGAAGGAPYSPGLIGPPNFGPPVYVEEPGIADLDVIVDEDRTGRFMFGVAVNSDAGLVGQVTVDERNFDITRFPTSFQDFVNGTAFRGAGQGFRLEAAPGSQVQRYLVSFTEPYLFDTNVSFNVSAFFFDRLFTDWDEQRLGGRFAFGYRLSPDLSLGLSLRMEHIDILRPRVIGVPELDSAVGESDLFSGRIALTHDTRDLPFAPTEGHIVEMSYEQVFGTFDYPRGEINARQYFMIRQRPDGSGRHTVALGVRAGFSGAQTPIFENFFAGGFTTLRGFRFRGAAPVVGGVTVGGEFMFLGSAEYLFPITADDMLKCVVFVDYGTIEDKVKLDSDNFRVAPGFGIRVNVPALGPAPLAFDFAFPVASADTDRRQIFSFFMGALR